MATPETLAGLKESALSLQEDESRLEELRSKSEKSEARAQELRDKFDIDRAEMVKNVRKDDPDLKDIKAQIRDANKQEAVKDAKAALARAKDAADLPDLAESKKDREAELDAQIDEDEGLRELRESAESAAALAEEDREALDELESGTLARRRDLLEKTASIEV